MTTRLKYVIKSNIKEVKCELARTDKKIDLMKEEVDNSLLNARGNYLNNQNLLKKSLEENIKKSAADHIDYTNTRNQQNRTELR